MLHRNKRGIGIALCVLTLLLSLSGCGPLKDDTLLIVNAVITEVDTGKQTITVKDDAGERTLMRGQGSQVSLGSMESAVNLSEGDFSCSAQDIGAYSFFTNTTRIIIRTDSPLDETVTVRLWNTENMSENILLASLDKKQKICTFTHLSSRNRYAITVDDMPDISISVSSRLTFWEALSQALQNE